MGAVISMFFKAVFRLSTQTCKVQVAHRDKRGIQSFILIHTLGQFRTANQSNMHVSVKNRHVCMVSCFVMSDVDFIQL